MADITSISEIIRPKPEVEKKHTINSTTNPKNVITLINILGQPEGKPSVKVGTSMNLTKYQLGAGYQLNQNHLRNIAIMLPLFCKLGINLLQYR